MLGLARVTILLCCGLISAVSQALEVPALTGRITDTAGLLDANAKQQYTAMLEAHEAKTGNQIAVLTLASLEGENLEAFTTKVFRTWKLGQKDKNNGVLLLIASQDRKLRIEVGYGLEGTLTDLYSDSIIRDRITPFFKRGDYAQGIGEGLRAMVALLEGEADTPTEDLDPSEDSDPSINLNDGLFGLDLFSDSGPPWPVRILMAIMFLVAIGMFGSVLGMFTYLALISPWVGWFIFLFLIPFWATIPIVIVGETIAPYLLGIYLIGFPITKLMLSRTAWYRKASNDLRTKGSARIGGFTIGGSSSGGSSSSSRSSFSSSSSSSSFSGGGGSSGGGGASGSW